MKNLSFGLMTLSFMLLPPSIFAQKGGIDIDSLGNPPVKPRLMLILDSSGSMNETDRFGDIKIDSAKIEISKILGKMPDGTTNVSLMAYDDCETKVLVPPSNTNIGRVQARAMSLFPAGQTPIAKSIQQAGQILGNNSQKTTIILISDGEETCGGDPCPETKRLKQMPNVNIKFHTIGYSVDDKTRTQLQCIAQAGDGEYHDVQDSFSLGTVVHEIIKEEITKTFDEDADGIRNVLDDCKATLTGFTVDKAGCETAYTMPTPFPSNSSTIEPELVRPVVNQLAEYLKQNPEKKAQIQGHADERGTIEYNQRLSEKRADFVKDQLIQSGISPQRLSSVGFGETRPIADNKSPLGQQKNRRVEAEFTD
ncbi:MAG: OmpA family protein [Pseudomonadota bacterium]